MNSMTGYGRAEASSADYQISIEVSSVNKKSLEVAVSSPKEWQYFEFIATSFFEKKVTSWESTRGTHGRLIGIVE